MNIGVIVICHNNAGELNPQSVIDNINATDKIKMCFVDNESKDDTLEKLLEIKESCEDKVSIVQIKKKVNCESAKRAGARYMFNNFDLKHIGFMNTANIIKNNYDINEMLNTLCENKDDIIAFDKENKSKQRIKTTFIKSIFSLLDYFKSKEYNERNNLKQSLL